MANRNFGGRIRTGNADVVKLYCKFHSAGTTAANEWDGTNEATAANKPSYSPVHNQGIASVTVAATGKYTITLEERYAGLLAVAGMCDDTGSSDKNYFEVETDQVNHANRKIVLQNFANDTAAAITDGNIVWVELTLLNNTTV